MIGLPPFEASAVYEITARTSSGTAVTLVGTSGWAAIGTGVGVAVAIAMPHAPSETVAVGATAADNEEIIKSTRDVALTENGSDATGLLSVPTLMTCAWMPDT